MKRYGDLTFNGLSSVKKSKKVAFTVTSDKVATLNKVIQPKIRQNADERTASMHIAAQYIVGSKE